MDEKIDIYEDNKIIITQLVLNNDKDIKLLRGFEEDTKKRYIRNIVIMIGDEFITSNVADTMLFKEELALFSYGDKQNKYFFPSTRTINQENVYSLEISLSNDKKIYITRSEAKAMVGLWNMSLQGYSFARLLEFEREQTLETWTLALEANGYFELIE